MHKSGYTHILVGTDFSERAARAVAAANRLAERVHTRLTVLHVHDPTHQVSAQLPGRSLAEFEQHVTSGVLAELQRWTAGVISNRRAEVVVVCGSNPALTLCAQAEERGADLCVIATHPRSGLQGRLIGSTAEKVLRHVPCDLLTIHPTAPAHAPLVERMVAATDLSDASVPALEAVGWMARLAQAEVLLLHVRDGSSHPADDGEALRLRLRMTLGALHSECLDGYERVATEVIDDKNAAEAVCARAEELGAGLIVIGRHGRSGVQRLLIGSVAERIVRFAHCSVLCVRKR